MSLTIAQEYLRKTIHLSSLWIPAVFCCFHYHLAYLLLFITTILTLGLDISRNYHPRLAALLAQKCGAIMRPHEQQKLCGASYFMLASLITYSFFPFITAQLAILVLIVSDSAAALIGKKWGRIKLQDKTIEGTIAFIVSGFIVAIIILYYYNLNLTFIIKAIIAIIAAGIVELFSSKIKLDDNLTIPLTIGCVISLINIMF